MTDDRPYLTDLAITDDGDLAVNHAGEVEPRTGPMNCAQALILRCRTQAGSLPLHPDYGSRRLLAQIGAKALDDTLAVSALNVELRAAIRADPRLLAARDLAVERGDDISDLLLSATVQLAGGEDLVVHDLLAGSTAAVTVEIPSVDVDDARFEEYVDASEDELRDELPELEGLEASDDEIEDH